MTRPVVLGVDLSLSSTGLAIGGAATRFRTSPRDGAPAERRARIAAHVANTATGLTDWHQAGDVDLVVIEGLNMHSVGDTAALAMLHGVVLDRLADVGIQPAMVAPSLLKKWACGRGNANKDAMVAAARDQLGYTGRSDDEADARWLEHVGLALLGQPVTAERAALLAGVQWPEGRPDLPTRAAS
jgi:crossover junction endodeoxyribonuclease RuvC